MPRLDPNLGRISARKVQYAVTKFEASTRHRPPSDGDEPLPAKPVALAR